MNASIISFSCSNHAQVISSQYLKDEHYLIDNFILIDDLGLAAVKLAASLENFVFDILPNFFDFSSSLMLSPEARRQTFLAQKQCNDDFTP